MYRAWKASLIGLTIFFQILTVIFAMTGNGLVLYSFGANILSAIAVIIVFIIERKKEKKEEIDYENSNY
ncbi:hypothetical protein [Bacillus sp. FJAT-45037]|uniref:hypothetical protein n=1 Tax=Bacillus sp. FJAT-45037 TaxID=2011007 RepID=UPI000C23E820|nr:hypothetical protein [Bacillus sp. FJAT-45037]